MQLTCCRIFCSNSDGQQCSDQATSNKDTQSIDDRSFSVNNYKEVYTNEMLVIDFGPMRKL